MTKLASRRVTWEIGAKLYVDDLRSWHDPQCDLQVGKKTTPRDWEKEERVHMMSYSLLVLGFLWSPATALSSGGSKTYISFPACVLDGHARLDVCIDTHPLERSPGRCVMATQRLAVLWSSEETPSRLTRETKQRNRSCVRGIRQAANGLDENQ